MSNLCGKDLSNIQQFLGARFWMSGRKSMKPKQYIFWQIEKCHFDTSYKDHISLFNEVDQF